MSGIPFESMANVLSERAGARKYWVDIGRVNAISLLIALLSAILTLSCVQTSPDELGVNFVHTQPNCPVIVLRISVCNMN